MHNRDAKVHRVDPQKIRKYKQRHPILRVRSASAERLNATSKRVYSADTLIKKAEPTQIYRHI